MLAGAAMGLAAGAAQKASAAIEAFKNTSIGAAPIVISDEDFKKAAEEVKSVQAAVKAKAEGKLDVNAVICIL